MKGIRLLIIFLFFLSVVSGQRLHLGAFGGLAAYNGDLTEKVFPKKVTNGAIGISVNYELKDQMMLRGGFTYSVVGGADRYSRKPELIKRNLSFETSIAEFSILGEYYLYNLYDRRYSPYIFAGLAVYHFDPYAFNASNDKIFLKPLSTEGQGLSGYPSRKPYSLTQAAIPIGGGIKFVINDKFRIGLEVGIRKLFTDYFDDVSSTYADPNDLLAAKGQLAVDISYRGDEIATGSPVYPSKGFQRGGEKSKDVYYFTGIHLTYRLGAVNGNGSIGSSIGKKRLGCPTVPL